MNYTQLGTSELYISEISFGCMSLTEDTLASRQLIRSAFEKGITYFDTADLYQAGQNEELLGKAVKSFRKEILIGTKVGNQLRQDGSGWDWNPSKAYIIASVEESLRRLQTDYIDLYQLHGGTIDDPIEETIAAFEQLKKEGKIRYYGISSIRPNVISAYVKKSAITSVMMQYSLLDRRPEESCLQLLKDTGIGVLARGTVAKGILAGKPITKYLSYDTTEVATTMDAVRELSGAKRTMCQTAIQYVLAGAVSSAVLGVRTPAQLEECIATTTTKRLSTTALFVLRQSNQPALYTQHR